MVKFGSKKGILNDKIKLMKALTAAFMIWSPDGIQTDPSSKAVNSTVLFRSVLWRRHWFWFSSIFLINVLPPRLLSRSVRSKELGEKSSTDPFSIYPEFFLSDLPWKRGGNLTIRPHLTRRKPKVERGNRTLTISSASWNYGERS